MGLPPASESPLNRGRERTLWSNVSTAAAFGASAAATTASALENFFRRLHTFVPKYLDKSRGSGLMVVVVLAHQERHRQRAHLHVTSGTAHGANHP